MTSQQTPYYSTDSGTQVYGRNRPGYSAWRKFDSEVAEVVRPQQRSVSTVTDSAVTVGKWVILGPIIGFVACLILVNILPVPRALLWVVLLGGIFGLPYYGWRKAKADRVDSKVNAAFNTRSHDEATQAYEALTIRARSGDIDSRLPAKVRSWGLGALSEEKVGGVLERLGPGYEVAHDLTIRQQGREVANIDHLVATADGLVMVDAKSWSGVVTVDQATGEVASANGIGDEYRRKAIHSLRREAQSLGLPLRAVVIAVDKGKVIGTLNGNETAGVARILDDHAFDTYIVEVDMLAELMGLLSQGNTGMVRLPEAERWARQRGSEIEF